MPHRSVRMASVFFKHSAVIKFFSPQLFYIEGIKLPTAKIGHFTTVLIKRKQPPDHTMCNDQEAVLSFLFYFKYSLI